MGSATGLKVLFVSAEVAPFSAIGGLAQVAHFLPKSLRKAGVDISIFTPKYGIIDEKKYHLEPLLRNLRVPTGAKIGQTHFDCNVKVRHGSRHQPTVYFLENQEYYERRANVYNYSDDYVRFALLSRAVLEFIRVSSMRPSLIHVNDWHTGYLPNFLATTYGADPLLKAITTVFTIHNLRNQGAFDFRYASPMDFDDGKSPISSLLDEALRKQNALKRGIIYSDLVNTVSETYSHEIMTPEYGEGLHELMREVRTKMFGVLNGLDYSDFDPSADHIIRQNYSWKTLGKRAANKEDLQESFNLRVDAEAPILAYCGRLDTQKGLDLFVDIIPSVLSEHQAQLVVIGTGDRHYREFFVRLEKQFPGQVGVHLMANFTLPRKIFSGCDMLLLPSRFEPGGIVVIEGMRYGAVPVVRATGGLADIVEDFNPEGDKGNGFTFQRYDRLSFFGAIVRAIQVYRNKRLWSELVKRVMREDFSWDRVAGRYIDLYERAIRFRRERQSPVLAMPHETM